MSARMHDVSPTVAIAERARHWLAARSEPEAFAALLEAARSAATASAWAEACTAYEAALALWDRIEDPVSAAASTRSGILEQAAEIAWCDGDGRRALALDRRAQQEPDVMVVGQLRAVTRQPRRPACPQWRRTHAL